jgi:hypothetical protein
VKLPTLDREFSVGCLVFFLFCFDLRSNRKSPKMGFGSDRAGNVAQ